jgi:hypothetical protein
MFILSAFADRPYWLSCLEPLLYPSGCSFYRPFSYREEYVAEPLRSELRNPVRLDAFLSDQERNTGLFGIRFKDESEPQYRGRFIPLRKVRLTNVQVSDTYQLSFKIEEYIKLTANETLQSVGLDDIVDYRNPEDTLLFEIPETKLEAFSSFSSQPNLPSRLWDKLADDQTLSQIARRNFIGTIVLRLVQISERGETTPLIPESLEPTVRHKTFGFRLESNKSYDLDLAYNRILSSGEKMPPEVEKSPPEVEKKAEGMPFDFAFRSPSEHFDIAQDRVPLTGNYRRQTIWLEPKVGRPGPIFLDWIGVKKTDRDSMADPKIDKILTLHVPVLTLAEKWPTERIVYAVIVTVTFVGALVSLYFAIRLGTRPVVQTPQQPAQPPSPLIPLLTSIAAFSLATSAAYFKDVIKGKS